MTLSSGLYCIFSGMASNYMFSDTSPPESQQPSYRPLTSPEREQLRAHENVDLILAWALVKKDCATSRGLRTD